MNLLTGKSHFLGVLVILFHLSSSLIFALGFGFQVIDVRVSLLGFFVLEFCDNSYKFQLNFGFGFGIVFQNWLLSDLRLGLGFEVVHLEGPISWGFGVWF